MTVAAAAASIAAALLVGGAMPAQADCQLLIICTSPTPSVSPSASPRPPAPPPTKPAAPAAKPASKPSPSPSPAAAGSQVTAQFQNAAFLDDLLQVLNHPASDQQPDLKHFRVDAQAAAADAGAADAQRLATVPVAEVLGFVAIWTLALGLGLGLGLRRQIRFRRLRSGAILALVPLVAVTAAGLHAATPAHPAPVAAHAAVAARAFGPGLKSTTTADDLDPLLRFLQPNTPAWNRLVSIESQVALHQDQLRAQEKQIQTLATSAGGTSSPQPTATPAAADLQTVMGNLLAQHDATTQAYKQALQQEYDLYRQAAQIQSLRDQLTTSSAALSQPDARDAVSYDIQVLQTQLTQESAINAAEAKLSAIGSLSATQLAAMRQHQPFIIPVEAPISQGFGPTDFSLEPPLTYNGTFFPHFHTGLDITGPLDTPVHAAADGVVALATATQDGAGHLTGYGNYVVIAHPDGFLTLYGHLNSVAVKEGQVVHQGEIIGQEGSTGLSTGPHVHFEIRHNGQFLDPAPYLAGQIPG